MTLDSIHAWIRLLAEPETTTRALEDLLARPGGPDPDVRRSIEAWLRIVRPVAPEGRVADALPRPTPSVLAGRRGARHLDDEPWDDDVLDDEPWEDDELFDLETPFDPEEAHEPDARRAKGAA
ncbi:MAG: hypothetical protein U0230_15165 [Polyangiales bacterium]